MNDQTLPGPGWYPDPNDAATNRYWDGQNWTESRAPIAQSAQKAEFKGADAVGYVLAILLPLIGFIIGLVRLNKSKHGIWIVVTSVVIFILWLALISSAGTAGAQTGGVTLEPGTKLTVVCEKHRPFRGEPFSVEGGHWAWHSRVYGQPVRTFHAGIYLEPEVPRMNITQVVVKVRRLEKRVYLIRPLIRLPHTPTTLNTPILWRGC